MTTLAQDLAYLAREAFSFSLEVNPHAPPHSKIDEHLFEVDADDWLSPEQREEAYRTGRFISAQVYPCGSVGFFLFLGTDAAALVAACAGACREDREEYKRQGLLGGATSRAFEPTPLPAT